MRIRCKRRLSGRVRSKSRIRIRTLIITRLVDRPEDRRCRCRDDWSQGGVEIGRLGGVEVNGAVRCCCYARPAVGAGGRGRDGAG
jgi:hypothetical protein